MYNQAQSVLERSLQTNLTVMKNPQVLRNAGTCEWLDITLAIIVKLSPEVVKVPLIESSLRSLNSLLSSDFVYFFLPCQILHDHQTCKPSLSARGLYKSDHHQFYCHQIRTRGPATKVGRAHQREICPYTVKPVYNSHPWERARWP